MLQIRSSLSTFLRWTGAAHSSFGTRTFTTSMPVLARSYRYVTMRRVKQKPALKTNYWVKMHLKTGRKIKYPPYPYGDSHIFKRSNRGLYGGKFPQYGNSVTERKGPKAPSKSRRRWLPHIVKTTLVSETLKKRIPLRLAASVWRTIKKEGGLDQYLLKDKPARIKELGPRGWRLRYAVLLRKRELEAAEARRAARSARATSLGSATTSPATDLSRLLSI